MPSLAIQTAWLFLLAIPIATISWTCTHEEIFREPREFCAQMCKRCEDVIRRKFFYVFTCEYCFSHYVTAFFLIITRYKLLFPDWRGYLIAGFALVWIANLYMSIMGRIRVELKVEKIEADLKKAELEVVKIENPDLAEKPKGPEPGQINT